MRVAHICITHISLDTRAFFKECRALAAGGHDVHLLAPDPPSPCVDGVRFHPVARARPNAWSVLSSAAGACRKAASLRADVYHIHETALMPVGVVLKLAGSKVIYDVHEDAPKQVKLVGRNKGRTLAKALCSLTLPCARGAPILAIVSVSGAPMAEFGGSGARHGPAKKLAARRESCIIAQGRDSKELTVGALGLRYGFSG